MPTTCPGIDLLVHLRYVICQKQLSNFSTRWFLGFTSAHISVETTTRYWKKNPHLQTPRCSRSLGSKVKSNKLVTFTKEESSASRYLVQRRWPSEGFVWLHFFKYRKNIWCIYLFIEKMHIIFFVFLQSKGKWYIYIQSFKHGYIYISQYIFVNAYISKFVLSV